MTPEHAAALAADALGTEATAFEVLGADSAISLGWGDRVVRVGGPLSATGIPLADWAVVLAELSPVLVAPIDAPIMVDGHVVLVFPRLPITGDDAFDAEAAGAALAALHADGSTYLDHVTLPSFDPLALARSWLGRAGDLVPATVGTEIVDQIVRAWTGVSGPRTVLHGDAHAANWCADATGRWRLIDADYLGVGPAVYDLAPLAVVDERLGRGPERAVALRRAYEAAAGPVDDASLAAASRVRALLSVLWFAARDGADAEAVRERLVSLGSGPSGARIRRT